MRLRFALSRSFCVSALIWNVVCRLFWFPEASSLTLYLAMTCFIISPRVAGLPSFPGDKSNAPNVNVSVTPVGFTAVGLMRGPLPHAAFGAPLAAGEPVESEGKAVWELVSNSCLEGTGVDEETLTGVSFREGKGSGAPSKLCFFYTKSSSFPEHALVYIRTYLKICCRKWCGHCSMSFGRLALTDEITCATRKKCRRTQETRKRV